MARRGKWFRISNAVIDEHGRALGPHGLAVYMALSRHVNGDGVCYPSVTTLTRAIGASARTVQRQLRRLEDAGLLRVVGRRTGGRGLATTYQLLDPEDVTERVTDRQGIVADKGRQRGTLSTERVTETTERVTETTIKGDSLTPQQDLGRRPIEQDSSSSSSSLGRIAAIFVANGFGEITELTRADLVEMVDEYGADEVEEALKQANRQRVRTLAYVGGILRGRRKEKNAGSTTRRQPRTATDRRRAGQDKKAGGKFSGVSTDVSAS